MLILPSRLNLNGTVRRMSRPFSCATCRTWEVPVQASFQAWTEDLDTHLFNARIETM